MNAYGDLTEIEDGIGFHVFVPFPETYLLEKREITKVEVIVGDSRTISADQRMKLYSTMRDIADYTGYSPEEYKAIAKYDFIAKTGCNYFSLSDCDVTTAYDFQNYLIDFCLEWDIPTKDSLLDRTPDISRYLYSCIANKRCAVCGKKAQLHHAEDRVQSGRNRKEIVHEGMRVQPLCGGINGHHSEVHNIGQQTFNEKWKIYGIKLDKHLCKILKLKLEQKEA